VLDGCRSYAIAFADLFHSELAPANTASPARGRRLHDSGHWVVIGAPGWYEFATALRTLSLDHKPSGSKQTSHRLSTSANSEGESYPSPQP
jgi:hypothetical protein